MMHGLWGNGHSPPHFTPKMKTLAASLLALTSAVSAHYTFPSLTSGKDMIEWVMDVIDMLDHHRRLIGQPVAVRSPGG